MRVAGRSRPLRPGRRQGLSLAAAWYERMGPVKGRKLSTLPLYGSERVEEWPENSPVVLVEGEKARDTLASIYPQTLGTVTGAEGTPGLETLEVLRDRRVVLWPDNDGPGRAHMERISVALQGIA